VVVALNKLRATELVRLLNTTDYGTVIEDRQLYRDRLLAGFRIGDDKYVDLFRYAAWMHERLWTPKASDDVDSYGKNKERANTRLRAISQSARDIGPLPPVAHKRRRKRCAESLKDFCETYFPSIFCIRWSVDHLRVINKIETAVRKGGLFGVAMPRGSGKTSLCKAACLWAALYGYRRFIVLIGPTEEHAELLLNDLRTQLESNDLLMSDFPEVCFPIRALDGIAHRCRGQLYQGTRTNIEWKSNKLVLPTIPKSQSSGTVIMVAGITGQIRGMTHQLPDGSTARPDLVLIDDPQTDESARSPSQCAHREAVISRAILGLAGPGKKIAGLMPCTVMCPGDLADNLLDKEKHPEWQGERFKLLYSFPKNMELWKTYNELRKSSLKEKGDISLATAFYAEHREAMDEGAVIAWPERYEEGELSAIQHAMNIYFRDEAAFYAEYQNEPLVPDGDESTGLDADQVAVRLSRLKRGVIPNDCQHLTAFIDVHQDLLYWIVVAWQDDATSYIIDYGTWPKQPHGHFTLANASKRLPRRYPGLSIEAALYAGLRDLCEEILGKTYLTETEEERRVDRCLIDANWGQATDIVYRFCRESQFSHIILPSHGRFVGASSRPLAEYNRRRGDRVGNNWRITATPTKKVRAVQYDTNYWKSWVAARLTAPVGGAGCMVLFGDNADHHRLIAEHITAEYPVSTEARGRRVEEWRLIPGRDNHWFDCLVGCAVAASINGVAVSEGDRGIIKQRPKKTLADFVRRRNG